MSESKKLLLITATSADGKKLFVASISDALVNLVEAFEVEGREINPITSTDAKALTESIAKLETITKGFTFKLEEAPVKPEVPKAEIKTQV